MGPLTKIEQILIHRNIFIASQKTNTHFTFLASVEAAVVNFNNLKYRQNTLNMIINVRN